MAATSLRAAASSGKVLANHAARSAIGTEIASSKTVAMRSHWPAVSSPMSSHPTHVAYRRAIRRANRTSLFRLGGRQKSEVGGDFLPQPCAGGKPVAVDGFVGNGEDSRCLFD